jgi:hypothetical protein
LLRVKSLFLFDWHISKYFLVDKNPYLCEIAPTERKNACNLAIVLLQVKSNPVESGELKVESYF